MTSVLVKSRRGGFANPEGKAKWRQRQSLKLCSWNKLGATRSWKGNFGENAVLRTTCLWIFLLRTVRKFISVVWSHPVCGDLSRQPQETHRLLKHIFQGCDLSLFPYLDKEIKSYGMTETIWIFCSGWHPWLHIRIPWELLREKKKKGPPLKLYLGPMKSETLDVGQKHRPFLTLPG